MEGAASSSTVTVEPEAHEEVGGPGNRFGKLKKLVGKGSSKSVYEADDLETGRRVAWNEVNIKSMAPKELDRLLAEIKFLKTLRNDCLIKFFGAFSKGGDRIIFITELMTSGTLADLIHKYPLTRRMIKELSKNILQGLQYLHTQPKPVVHRDIKCSNIFFANTDAGESKFGRLKIGDLGLATVDPVSSNGTPEYMAPEMYDAGYNWSVDIYAFGMCVMQMITRVVPYSECTSLGALFKKVENRIPPACFDEVRRGWEEAFVFISKCVSLEPNSEGKFVRPSASELLLDPFLIPLPNDDKMSNQDILDLVLADNPEELARRATTSGGLLGRRPGPPTRRMDRLEEDTGEDEVPSPPRTTSGGGGGSSTSGAFPTLPSGGVPLPPPPAPLSPSPAPSSLSPTPAPAPAVGVVTSGVNSLDSVGGSYDGRARVIAPTATPPDTSGHDDTGPSFGSNPSDSGSGDGSGSPTPDASSVDAAVGGGTGGVEVDPGVLPPTPAPPATVTIVVQPPPVPPVSDGGTQVMSGGTGAEVIREARVDSTTGTSDQPPPPHPSRHTSETGTVGVVAPLPSESGSGGTPAQASGGVVGAGSLPVGAGVGGPPSHEHSQANGGDGDSGSSFPTVGHTHSPMGITHTPDGTGVLNGSTPASARALSNRPAPLAPSALSVSTLPEAASPPEEVAPTTGFPRGSPYSRSVGSRTSGMGDDSGAMMAHASPTRMLLGGNVDTGLPHHVEAEIQELKHFAMATFKEVQEMHGVIAQMQKSMMSVEALLLKTLQAQAAAASSVHAPVPAPVSTGHPPLPPAASGGHASLARPNAGGPPLPISRGSITTPPSLAASPLPAGQHASTPVSAPPPASTVPGPAFVSPPPAPSPAPPADKQSSLPPVVPTYAFADNNWMESHSGDVSREEDTSDAAMTSLEMVSASVSAPPSSAALVKRKSVIAPPPSEPDAADKQQGSGNGRAGYGVPSGGGSGTDDHHGSGPSDEDEEPELTFDLYALKQKVDIVDSPESARLIAELRKLHSMYAGKVAAERGKRARLLKSNRDQEMEARNIFEVEKSREQRKSESMVHQLNTDTDALNRQRESTLARPDSSDTLAHGSPATSSDPSFPFPPPTSDTASATAAAEPQEAKLAEHRHKAWLRRLELLEERKHAESDRHLEEMCKIENNLQQSLLQCGDKRKKIVQQHDLKLKQLREEYESRFVALVRAFQGDKTHSPDEGAHHADHDMDADTSHDSGVSQPPVLHGSGGGVSMQTSAVSSLSGRSVLSPAGPPMPITRMPSTHFSVHPPTLHDTVTAPSPALGHLYGMQAQPPQYFTPRPTEDHADPYSFPSRH